MKEVKPANIEISELKRWMRGRWLGVLSTLGNEELRAAVRRWEDHPTRKAHGPCPVHGGKHGDAFRLFERGAKHGGADETGGGYCNTCGGFQDGLKLLMAANGWSLPQTLTEVAMACGFRPGAGVVAPAPAGAPPTQAQEVAQQKEDRRRHWRMRQAHKESVPVCQASPASAIVRRYLASRGITEIPQTADLRAHAALYYRPGVDEDPTHAGKYPAMLGVVRAPDGRAVSLHRTWLTGEGRKAALAQPKREIARPSYFSTQGAAIRLDSPTWILGVAEGLETALSARQATGLPVWSTLNRVLLEQLVVPADVRMVVVFSDKDVAGVQGAPGQKSAAKLAERLLAEGRDVVLSLPPDIPGHTEGVDWNDVLVRCGREGFPEFLRVLAQGAEPHVAVWRRKAG